MDERDHSRRPESAPVHLPDAPVDPKPAVERDSREDSDLSESQLLESLLARITDPHARLLVLSTLAGS